MSSKIIVLFAAIAMAQMVMCKTLKRNPTRHVAKRDPGACAYECVMTCYDSSVGSYNRRPGTCKDGYYCCEWVTFKKRSEIKYNLPANPLPRDIVSIDKRDPGACAYECVMTCYDSSVGSYNHRPGTCKDGYYCCEWVTFKKRSEPKYNLPGNPLYRYIDSVAKREPGACAYECVMTCYDSSVGSYNHRPGTCKDGYDCCEWVTFKKRNEPENDLPGNMRPEFGYEMDNSDLE